MTVQRWDVDSSGPWEADDGLYVTYADHVAEMERALDDDVLAAAHHGQKGYEVGYQKAVEDMRAACIKAVEALGHHADQPCGCEPCLERAESLDEYTNNAIAALREVQP